VYPGAIEIGKKFVLLIPTWIEMATWMESGEK
jgi:hypothetical protein